MAKDHNFNDAPILTPEQDRLDIVPFAEGIAKSLSNMKSPVGTTVAINGPWGSGKSSVINLIRNYLKPFEENDEIVIVDFKCWWFKGEEALTLAFMQELNTALKKTLGDEAKELIPRLSRKLLQAGSVIGPAITAVDGGIFSRGIDYVQKFFSEEESLEKSFNKLVELLKKQDRKYLVILDDIDRLTPDEVMLIFRLIKSIGMLPNIIYLLAFDREIAEKTVAKSYPSEGPHFLEKIIQGSFDLPLPARDDLNVWIANAISDTCSDALKKIDENHATRFWNVFHDSITPFIQSPRDVTKLKNSIEMTWPSVGNDVNLADYVAIETIRLLEPELFRGLAKAKDILCQYSLRDSQLVKEEVRKDLIDLVSDKAKANAENALMRLFPVLENIGYSNDFVTTWASERRVCTKKHFDTYFRLAVSPDVMRQHEIDKVINNTGDRQYVEKLFKDAVLVIRRNGRSRVPLLMDELNVHAESFPDENIEPFLTGLFAVADDIHREDDRERGMMAFGDNLLRIHWLMRRLTRRRFSLAERSQIYLNACQTASLEWLLDFTISSIRDYNPSGEDKEPALEEDCLVLEGALPSLKALAGTKFRESLAEPEFIRRPNLAQLLFMGADILDDDALVKQWMSEQINTDEGVAFIAKGFTGEARSQGMGFPGLGDRVETVTKRAQVDSLKRLADLNTFEKRAIEVIENKSLDKALLDYVEVFMKAWKTKDDFWG